MSLYFEWRKSCGCQGPCSCSKEPKRYEPNYYFDQSDETMEIAPDSPTKVMEMEVTTSLPHERVKLDAMLETFILVGTDAPYSFIIEYSLLRNSIPLTSESFAMVHQLGQPDLEKTIMNTIKITWTDIIPVPGKYVYKVEINRGTLPNQNILNVAIQDRSLNAITFSPVKRPKNM